MKATDYRRRSSLRAGFAALALTASCALVACSPEQSDDGVQAVTAFYPLQFVTEQVGGQDVTVTSLTPPGADPHSLEVAPAQVAELAGVELVVYSAGLQPAVDDAVEGQPPERLVNAWEAAGIEADLLGRDPHFWLDPELLIGVAKDVAAQLSAADPANANAYAGRAEELAGKLTELDQAYAQGLQECSGAVLVTSHEAFGYLAEKYDLEQQGIAGIDPEAEPSPARMRDVAELVEANDVKTLFFETITAPDVTKALAEEAGVETALLDPLEAPPSEGDYLSTMRANLKALQDGLNCG